MSDKSYIYAFDISLNSTGVAIFDSKDYSVKGVYSYPMKSGTHGQKLRTLEHEVMRLMKEYPPKELVIEMGFVKYNDATKAIFKAHGIIECRFWELEVHYLTPSEWKKVICGSGNASKDIIQSRLKKKFDLSFKNEDESDALGLGIAYLVKKHKYIWNKVEPIEEKKTKKKITDK